MSATKQDLHKAQADLVEANGKIAAEKQRTADAISALDKERKSRLAAIADLRSTKAALGKMDGLVASLKDAATGARAQADAAKDAMADASQKLKDAKADSKASQKAAREIAGKLDATEKALAAAERKLEAAVERSEKLRGELSEVKKARTARGRGERSALSKLRTAEAEIARLKAEVDRKPPVRPDPHDKAEIARLKALVDVLRREIGGSE